VIGVKIPRGFLIPAFMLGGLLPIILPIILFISGKLRKNSEKILAGLALGQAAILGSVISSIYKTFTGRIQPDFANPTLDISGDFNFGFLQHGIFWGWPSSHTTIAFAMAFTLITLYPKLKNLRYAALLYALYIGAAVSLSIHWFSEFIAGAIIGAVIGVVVGKSFREKIKKAN
jgi:membrane-associated phospholipid phosphatase